MYFFIEPLTEHFDSLLSKKFKKNYSEYSSEPEGYVLSEDDLNECNITKDPENQFKMYDIPDKYQNCIDNFISDYWDGEFMFNGKMFE